ncbi:MAG: enoyl-CoA hydratase/isomerase family protein [Promethearchaeota archaeon]
MEFETIIYEIEKKVATITINRPEKLNALNFQLLDELDDAFNEAKENKSVKVVILKGNGKSFCSGYDLNDSPYLRMPEEGWNYENTLLLLRKFEEKYMRIWNFPKPTIAQIHGHALAAGCYLQLLCDISVAAEDAILGHPAMKWGGVTSMPLWQVYLGVKKARYLLFTGRTISGKEAEQIGLVSLSVPLDKLDETVNTIASELKSIPHEGILHSKEILNTDLEIMGTGALFRYHGQNNAIGRLLRYK